MPQHEVAAPVGYMRGRTARTPGAALPSPAKTVRAYLAAMEKHDHATARSLLAENFSAVFPGAVRLDDPVHVETWAVGRYRAVRKHYERIDEVPGKEGVVVYASGTLDGEWFDGAAFAGVRFIDRFTVLDGLLVDQQVWNDLAEVHAGSR